MIGQVATRALTGIVLLGLGGCVAHFKRDQQTAESYRYEAPNVAAASLHYTANGPVALEPPIRRLRYHEAIPFSFGSTGSNGHASNRVEGLYLKSRLGGARKLLIVLPIWGTSTYPPRKVAYGYAHHSRGDAHVIWVFGEPPLFPWRTLWSTASEAEWVAITEDGIERYRTAIIDTRRLLDWVGSRREIDADRVALIGFSMGALAAATLMGNDPRVSTGIFMLGGANYAEVMAWCRGKAGRIREHALKRYGWSLDAYREFFARRIGAAEPVRYAGRYNPDRILMIDAKFDNCIPPQAREALWEATGRPERVTMLYRHKGAFYSLTPLGFNLARGMIYRFLDRTL